MAKLNNDTSYPLLSTPLSTDQIVMIDKTADAIKKTTVANIHLGMTAASTTIASKVELATAAETTTGTDSTRAVTPESLKSSDYGALLDRSFNIQVIIGDGVSAITTVVPIKAWVQVPHNCTVQSWTLVADASGSIVIDVWREEYADVPATVADTIAGSEKPTLASVQKNEDTSLSTWTTSLVKGDWLYFNVDSTATVKQVTLSLSCVATA